MIDLRPDEEARLRRVFRYLDDEAPVAPDLQELGFHTAARTRDRRFPPVLVGAAAFLLTLMAVLPALLFSSDNPVDVDTVVDTGTSPTTVALSAPAESAPPDISALPALEDFEQVSLPPVGDAEFMTIAASSDALYAAAIVPDPDDWEVKVWRSSDGGNTWEETLELINDGLETDLVATEDELVLLMSDHVGDGGASVYRSTNDGQDWTRFELSMPEGAAGISTRTLVDGPATVILGSAWNEVRDTVHDDGAVIESELVGWRGVAWVLDNGQILGPFDNPGVGIVTDSEFHNGQYYAVGAEPSVSEQPAAWTSSDGITWRRVDLPELPSGWILRDLDTVTSTGETLIAVGEIRTDSSEESQTAGTAIYQVIDGQKWQLHLVEDHLIGHITATPGGFIGSASTADTFEFATSTNGVAWDYQPADMRLIESSDSAGSQYLVGIDSQGQRSLLRLVHD